MKENRTRYIVGNIRDDRIGGAIWSVLQNILMVDGKIRSLPFFLLTFFENLDHICIEFDEIELTWFLVDQIFCECAISRSDFDDMLSRDFDRCRNITEGFGIDEKILSESFFCFNIFFHKISNLS